MQAYYGAEPAMTELMSMIKDLRYDLTIQVKDVKIYLIVVFIS